MASGVARGIGALVSKLTAVGQRRLEWIRMTVRSTSAEVPASADFGKYQSVQNSNASNMPLVNRTYRTRSIIAHRWLASRTHCPASILEREKVAVVPSDNAVLHVAAEAATP